MQAPPAGALDPSALDSLVQLTHHLPLALERVVYPCSSVNCGDIIYRSTLDPSLRADGSGVSPLLLVVLAPALAYLTAPPGVLQGFFDTYLRTPFLALTTPKLTREGVEVGRKLATGGFGTVYLGTAGTSVPGQIRKGEKIIVKKATEFGEAEVWMNERLSRAAPAAVARFLTAYADGQPRVGTPLVLVWKFEGPNTLDDLMRDRDFPLNAERLLLGRQLRIPDAARRLVVTKVIMQQLLECVAALHATGIVHRDVKPQNMILSEADGRMKLIDLGAAADLRVGINYVPNEYLLDPRYAPPQQYIMSPLTPKAPPAPVAALLSPVLWRLNQPDRFDMYSCGVVMLQLVFASLRTDNALIAFNKRLEELDYDLRAWRASLDRRAAAPYAEGLELLDRDGGAGWELLCKLVTFRPKERYSAAQALRSRWFADDPTRLDVPTRVLSAVDSALGAIDVDGALEKALAGNRDAISEVRIYEELSMDEEGKAAPPPPPQQMPRTIAWWQARERSEQLGKAGVLGKLLAPKPSGQRPKVQNGRVVGAATQRAFGQTPGRAKSKGESRQRPGSGGGGGGGDGAANGADVADAETTAEKEARKPSLLSVFDKMRS